MFEPGTMQLRFPHATRLLVSTPWVVCPPLLGRTLCNATFEPRTRIVTTGTMWTLVLPPSLHVARVVLTCVCAINKQ